MSHSRTYSSDSIDIEYNVRRCIHAAECVRGAPRVFDPKRKPWVDPSLGEGEAIAEVIKRCPTGALHFVPKEGGVVESAETTNSVSIQPDGPLYVRGDLRIETLDGQVELKDTRVALCRCGLSENKPFCDNTHVDAFSDSAALGTVNVIEPSGEVSELKIIPANNGPLLFRGPVTISAKNGAEVTTEKCALCRCGHSSNKPFCDGTHKEIGFES